MKATIERYTLVLIAVFAALSAIGGGYGVVSTNGLGMPLAWLANTPFADYTVPGLILLVVVGGSALLATVLLTRHHLQYVMAFGAGAIMVGWIFGEVLLLRQLSWLQMVYLAVGVAMMALALVEWLQQERVHAAAHH
jgi:hypothetical protein